MNTKLEPLLNTLLQRGWKPWGVDADFCDLGSERFKFIQKTGRIMHMCSLRELVGLESGLWQFVCENELLAKEYLGEWKFTLDGVSFNFYKSNFKYRLLESALVPEQELVQFLVDNIVIEG